MKKSMRIMLCVLCIVSMLFSTAFAQGAAKDAAPVVEGSSAQTVITKSNEIPRDGAASRSSMYEPLQVSGAYASTDTCKVGETIAWSVVASGGNGDYAYFFNIFCGAEVVQYGTWQLDPVCYWTPDKPGNYYVAAYAVDSRWTEIAGPASEGGVIICDGYLEPLSLEVDWSHSGIDAEVGDVLFWDLFAEGGNGEYQYLVHIFCGDEVVRYGTWRQQSYVYWDVEKPGNYYISAYVVDSRWTEIAQCPDGGMITVTDDSAGELRIDLVESSGGEQYVDEDNGAGVFMEVDVDGGTGEYAYCYHLFKDGVLIEDTGWVEDCWFSWEGRGPDAVGMYQVVCYVTDSSWSKTLSVAGDILVVKPSTLQLIAVNGPTAAQAGVPYTYTLTFTGGEEGLPFCFYHDLYLYDENGHKMWLYDTDWQETPAFTVVFPEPGEYSVEINIQTEYLFDYETLKVTVV